MEKVTFREYDRLAREACGPQLSKHTLGEGRKQLSR